MKFLEESETPVRERLKNPAPKPAVREDKTDKVIVLLTQVMEKLVAMKDREANIPKAAPPSGESLREVQSAIADLARATRERQAPAWKFTITRDRHGMIATIEAERVQYS